MLETAVGDSTNEFGLQQEVAETSGVNADVGTLLVNAVAGRSRVSLLAVGGGSGIVVGAELLVGVVDEILFSRHDGDCLVGRGKGVVKWSG